MEEIITQKKTIEGIGKNLEVNLKEYGFKFVKSKSALVRKTKDGFDKILLHTYDTYPYSHQDLFLQFSSRINVVQEIVNMFYDERFMNIKFHRSRTTIGIDYINLMGDFKIDFNGYNPKCDICLQRIKSGSDTEGKFAIHTEKDIEIITPLIFNFIKNRVFDFFSDNYDLNKLNLKFKNQISQYSHLTEKMTSLVLMKLTNDTDFNIKVKEYLGYMNHPGYEEDHKNAFNELVTYLKGN